MQFVNSTMITPKLTPVMVAVTSLIGAGPVAAFAQAANANVVGDLTNALNIETGGNTQVTEAESESEASGSNGDSKKKDDRYSGNGGSESESEAEAEAAALAVGGDAEAESGDATAVQVVQDNEFDQEVEQESETNQVNALEDNDDVTAIQANVPIQAQVNPIAADILLQLGLLDGAE